MKKILVLIIPLFLISSCGKLDKKTYVTLSGSLKNSIADTLQILNSKQVVLKNINLDNQSLFSDTLKVPEGYYSIKYDKEQAQIFLKPGFDLSISFISEMTLENLRNLMVRGLMKTTILLRKLPLINLFMKPCNMII